MIILFHLHKIIETTEVVILIGGEKNDKREKCS